MRLKEITINGFKSFADKTVIEFPDGVTAIVGPNGCGKSNIADGFRWVLGEQSAKSLRGSKMYDVIFAGSSQRKPLNSAEITITLEAPYGTLPMGNQEISITRRLYRTGESEYCLNGQVVRLKDIHSILLDSGIGRDAFSIFEQGKIDQVIHFTPLERRSIFEEASGIVRFLHRKKDAGQKLDLLDQNMMRLGDVCKEVEHQLKNLEQQAEKAQTYKETKTQLETLEKAVLVCKWDHLEDKWNLLKEKEKIHNEQLQESRQSVEQLKSQITELKSALETDEKSLHLQHEELFKTRNNKELQHQDLKNNQQRIEELQENSKKWKQELQDNKQQRDQRQKELLNQQKQLQKLEQEVFDLKNTLTTERAKEQSFETIISDLRKQQKKSDSERFQLTQQDNILEKELLQSKMHLENGQEKIAQLEQRKIATKELIKNYSQEVLEKKQQLDIISKSIDEHKETLHSNENEIHRLTDNIQLIQDEINQLITTVAENKARLKSLVTLQNEMEGFSDGSKRIIQESKNKASVLYQKVQELYTYIQPKQGFEETIAKALYLYEKALVVKTEEDLCLCLEFAKAQGLTDFSIICLEYIDSVNAKKKTNSVGLYENVSPSVLAHHFLNSVKTVDALEEGLDLITKNTELEILIPLDNIFIDKHKVIHFSQITENNFFSRATEIQELEKILVQNTQQKISLENGLKVLTNNKAHLQSELSQLDKSIRKEEMKLVEINFSLQRSQKDFEKHQAEIAAFEKESKVLQDYIIKLNQTLSSLNEKKAETKAAINNNNQIFKKLESEVDAQYQDLKKLQKANQIQDSNYQKAADEHQKLSHQLNLQEVKNQQSRELEQRLENEIVSNKTQQDQINQAINQLKASLEHVELSLKENTKQFHEFEQKVIDKKRSLEKTDKNMQYAVNGQNEKENALNKLQMQIVQFQSNMQSIETDLKERFQLTIEKARVLIESQPKDSLEIMEKQLRSLRQTIESFGNVNMTSIDEYEVQKERSDNLKNQINDLTSSKQDLLNIISQLEGDSKKLFKTTFDAVRSNFQKNFAILFNGGEADLQLTEGRDILEAGIEIIARPPGKHMRSIQLLSGGEKCLTSIALLFAIFEVKPAPFCILDEIDAPLDDSNVERFVNIVKQYMNKCQFLIITHNKRTMSIADVLFGVSMEEKGVSKVLSLDFSRKELSSHK